MGACSSCLGLGRRASHDETQTTRLLEDDLYHAGYGYGTLSQGSHTGQHDTEDLKREREALESICQRASDSVVDIWSLQPQSHLNPHQVSHGSVSVRNATSTPSSSRVPSSETPSAVAGEETSGGGSVKPETLDPKQQLYQETLRRAVASSSRANGAVIPPPKSQRAHLSAAPKHWGEVVMSTRKGKKVRPGLGLDADGDLGNEVFGVLQVK